jgi:hypothetical protein
MGIGQTPCLVLPSQDDEQAMEALFREILVQVPPSEVLSTTTADEEQQLVKEDKTTGFSDEVVSTKKSGTDILFEDTDEKMDDGDDDHQSTVVDWANEIEMQRLLDSLQQSSGAAVQQQHLQDFLGVDLGLGLISWNEVEGVNSTGVNVF